MTGTPMHYILVGRTPIAVDMLTWAKWFGDIAKRRVASDKVDDVRVSTIFLGLDHNWSGKGDPILFETMIFDGPLDGESWRYATYKQAEEGHAKAVAAASAARDRIKALAELAGARTE
jgi:hypothetical protein